MAGVDFGPDTSWPVQWTCDVMSESPAATGAAVAAATDILWAMSGMRFGTTTVTVRPCRRECRPTSFPGFVWDAWPGTGLSPLFQAGGGWPWPVMDAGCGSCAGSCSCTSLSEILFPDTVSAVTEVKVDGAVVVTGGYRLDDNRLLVRLGSIWPYCQNLNLADTEVGTFSVTVQMGEAVPKAGEWAVGELACEYLRAMRGENCQLPRNISSIARQGVSITLPDLTTSIKEGRLGLRLCDLFLHAVNPNSLQDRARTFSVDGPRAHRRVGT